MTEVFHFYLFNEGVKLSCVTEAGLWGVAKQVYGSQWGKFEWSFLEGDWTE